MLETDLQWPVELCSGESDDQLWELTLDALGQAADSDAGTVLPNLDLLDPGPFLGAILSAIDLSKLTGREVIQVIKAQYQQVSHHQAAVYRAMAEAAHCVEGDSLERSKAPDEYSVEEVGAALSLTRRKAEREVSTALALREHPHVRSALECGAIDSPKACLLTTDTDHLESGSAREVISHLLPRAGELTTGQLRARIRRLCIQIDPNHGAKRLQHSLAHRKVTAEPNVQGTAALIISECSPDDVYSARDHINLLARRMKTADESRSIDQLRADVAMDLLTGRISADERRTTGSVNIHVDLTTLARLDDEPAELDGFGPVVAEIARKVTAEQQSSPWTATVTDPETGEPVQVVSVRRRPTAKQLRKIRALHPTCAFVGCRMPARNCDIDHMDEYAKGGKTVVCKLAPLCRRHHMARHRGGWRYSRVSRRGVEWISPLGHRYRIRPPPRL